MSVESTPPTQDKSHQPPLGSMDTEAVLDIPRPPAEQPVSDKGLEQLLSFPNEDVKNKLKGESPQ